jgi:hypothetical protein
MNNIQGLEEFIKHELDVMSKDFNVTFEIEDLQRFHNFIILQYN